MIPLLALTVTGAVFAGDPYTLQPVESERGLQISGDGERAWAISAEGSRRLPLRDGELPTIVAELADGWVAAGLRREPDRRDFFVMRSEAGKVRRLAPPESSANFNPASASS